MNTPLDDAQNSYFEHHARLAEWIAGLTIGELAFIISQKFFILGVLFYTFLSVSALSVLLSVAIMYVRATVEDLKLHGTLTLTNKDAIPPRAEFDKSFDKRLGRIPRWIVHLVVDRKIFQWLILSFLAASVLMIILMIRYLNGGQNCA